MTPVKLKPAGFVAAMLMLFGSCGDLNFSSILSGDYEVSALVNKADIGDYPVIKREDLIAPCFINPVVKDPDLAGLAVFFEGPGGEELGRVYYSLSGKGQAGEKERTVRVSRLDKPFPVFPIPPELEPGRRILVFQVMRQDGVLSRIEKPVYYLGTAELAFKDVRVILPDKETMLVPPGIMVMLEAEVSVNDGDAVLEPYVIWYNGRAVIGEGPVYGGVHRLMWKAPEQTGFRTIRAELLPFNPEGTYLSAGQFRELSLPVSSNSEKLPSFAGDGETLTHWYRFRGDLTDLKTESPLVPQNGGEPQWRSRGTIYGMLLGAGDGYSLPAFPEEADQGYGRVICRFVPLGEGSLIRASFRVERSPRPLQMDLSISGGGLALSLGMEGQGGETITLDASLVEAAVDQGFITAFIDFRYDPGSFTADLALNGSGFDPGFQGRSLVLPGPISGGTLSLGTGNGAVPAAETAAPPAAENAAPAGEVPAVLSEAENGSLALLDEFLTAWSAGPFQN
jgi:hypothetical protein